MLLDFPSLRDRMEVTTTNPDLCEKSLTNGLSSEGASKIGADVARAREQTLDGHAGGGNREIVPCHPRQNGEHWFMGL
jgi:hypothetical protein